MFRSTVHARRLFGLRINVEAELGSDHDPVTHGPERFADDFLIGERAINLSRVEEGNASLHRRANEVDALFFTDCGAVAKVQPHATEADYRDFQITVSKFALLHCLL